MTSTQQRHEPKQVRWACRRGMLELDLVLLPFFDNRYLHLTSVQQDDFVALLQLPDPVLYTYFIGQEKAQTASEQYLVESIRDYHRESRA